MTHISGVGSVKPLWYEDPESGCWLWTGFCYGDGYAKHGGHLAARMRWLEELGEIPDGLVISHNCHDRSDCYEGVNCIHRRCVRLGDDHVSLVTPAQNMANRIARTVPRTECLAGHGSENFRRRPNGSVDCKECHRLAEQRRRLRLKGEVA